MSTYLGRNGRISLGRTSTEGGKYSTISKSDINTTKRRFSFDFDRSFLITGDLLEISSTNDATLAFISASGWANNTKQSSGSWYIFVDDIGGIRLYNNFADSLIGALNDAIALEAIVADIPVRVRVTNSRSRIIGQVTSYELNTNRETIDTTVLSDEFRSQYSGLMSGSGRISCQWDYVDDVSDGENETANYLLQLILRTEVGSEFEASLFVKTPGYHPSGDNTLVDDSLFYQINGVITNAAIAFQPTTIVEMTADFVTTGPVRLLTGIGAKQYLLQENSDKIQLEQNSNSYLLLEQED